MLDMVTFKNVIHSNFIWKKLGGIFQHCIDEH